MASRDHKVTYRPLYSIIQFVTNKSNLPQDGAQVFLYMGDWLKNKARLTLMTTMFLGLILKINILPII